jgi:hypothetical protein
MASHVANCELRKDGFICLAGPFDACEQDMIPQYEEDARRANKAVRLQETAIGTYIWQKSLNT